LFTPEEPAQAFNPFDINVINVGLGKGT